MRLDVFAVIILIISVGGCAAPSNKTVSDQEAAGVSEEMTEDGDFDFLEEEIAEQAVEVSDPLEGVNRLMYGVNDALYFWVAKPVVGLYTDVTNKPIRKGVRNFFHNLSTPIRFVNCHLQGKPAEADVELGRFLINSTFGILGIGDPAQEEHDMEIPKQEDLGQTLAVHGVKDGFYLVLPLLGPSTARDAVGRLGDAFLNPVYYVDPTEAAIGITAGDYTNKGSFHIGEYEAFKDAAIDPYAAMREVYIQYRTKQIEE